MLSALGPRRLALPAIALVALLLSGSVALGGARRHLCRAGLTVKMTHIRGSDGAGHTAYRLTVRNTSKVTCRFDSNHTDLALYRGRTAGSRRLPSHVVPQGKTHPFSLASGQAAHARLVFSPDVPGKDEPQRGPCEPRARSVSAAMSLTGSPFREGAAVRSHGPIVPPTSVCEHGRIAESSLH